MTDAERLTRIENAVRYLLDRLCFGTREVSSEEGAPSWEDQDKMVRETVERIMECGRP